MHIDVVIIGALVGTIISTPLAVWLRIALERVTRRQTRHLEDLLDPSTPGGFSSIDQLLRDIDEHLEDIRNELKP